MTSSRPNLLQRTDRFDLGMIIFVAILVLFIGVVVIRGDQVGLGVDAYGPIDSASAHATIHLQFNEPVDLAEVQKAFSIQPSIKGSWSASGTEVTFHPGETLPVPQEYSVSVAAGLSGADHRSLENPLIWHFKIRAPRVVYLSPASGKVQNLFMADPASDAPAKQLTHSAMGIASYDVSPDGEQLVYSEITQVKDLSYFATQLVVMNLSTGETRLTYDCKAMCTDLTWRPDGSMFAFQRAEFNLATGVGAGAARVWLFNISSGSARPFFSEDQRITFTPRWSPDGSRLAVVNSETASLIIRDIASSKDTVYPCDLWTLGTFSPNGRWLYFTRLDAVGADSATAVHVVLLDLSADPLTQQDIVPDTTEVSDEEAIWLPDSTGLIIARQPPARYNPRESALVEFDIASGTTKTLIPSDTNTRHGLTISPLGDSFVFETTPVSLPAPSDTWRYSLKDNTSARISQNATRPGWLP